MTQTFPSETSTAAPPPAMSRADGAPSAPNMATAAAMEAIIASRHSTRAFLPREVPRALLMRILDLAARAPSGSNIQPWQVQVLTGAPLRALGAELQALSLAGDPGEPGYAYYPRNWREPYLSRRRKVGWDLYSALGIGRADKDRMATQHALNFTFFGAPVGLIFTIDRDMEQGSWLDYGMFLGTVMIAARGLGLDTCPQAAFNRYSQVIARRLALPAERMVVCGMALGYADPAHPANAFTTEREPATHFTTFVEALA